MAAALRGVGWTVVGPYGRADPVADLGLRADLILLTVPDDAIATVAAAIEPTDAVIAHTSGAKGLGALAPHLRRASVHPLMSLPDPDTGAARLRQGGVFAIDGDPIARLVVDSLGGRPIEVGDDARALYHAAAAVAANHLVVLCGQVERLAALVGVPVEAYHELMSSTLDNVRRAGSVSSLTGPAARGDVSTLVAHLKALPSDEHQLYVTLAEHAAILAGTPLPTSWSEPDAADPTG